MKKGIFMKDFWGSERNETIEIFLEYESDRGLDFCEKESWEINNQFSNGAICTNGAKNGKGRPPVLF